MRARRPGSSALEARRDVAVFANDEDVECAGVVLRDSDGGGVKVAGRKKARSGVKQTAVFTRGPVRRN